MIYFLLSCTHDTDDSDLCVIYAARELLSIEKRTARQIVNPETTGDKYRFKFKDDSKFVGKIISPVLHIQTEKKKLRLKIWNIVEIIRIEDGSFAPPKFKNFLFRLKDSSQIAGQLPDKRLDVDPPFDACYQATPRKSLPSTWPDMKKVIRQF